MRYGEAKWQSLQTKARTGSTAYSDFRPMVYP